MILDSFNLMPADCVDAPQDKPRVIHFDIPIGFILVVMVFAFLLLSGCTTWNRERLITQSTITWTQTANVRQICEAEIGISAIACIKWDSSGSRIWTDIDPGEFVIGHEVMHAFGYRHE